MNTRITLTSNASAELARRSERDLGVGDRVSYDDIAELDPDDLIEDEEDPQAGPYESPFDERWG